MTTDFRLEKRVPDNDDDDDDNNNNKLNKMVEEYSN